MMWLNKEDPWPVQSFVCLSFSQWGQWVWMEFCLQSSSMCCPTHGAKSLSSPATSVCLIPTPLGCDTGGRSSKAYPHARMRAWNRPCKAEPPEPCRSRPALKNRTPLCGAPTILGPNKSWWVRETWPNKPGKHHVSGICS